MKNLKYLLMLILFTGVVFPGCKKALDVKFNATYHTDLNVDVSAGLRNVSFNESSTIDPASDPNFSKYFDKIKEIEVQDIKVEITSITKNVNLVTGTLSIYNESRSAAWNMNDIPLEVGTVITLDNSSGGWSTVSQILKDKQTFTVHVEGEVDEGDVSFTMKVTITTKVTANPL